ncbi:dihydroneopterin aldolase [Myxococcota bacterium]|nr:dihydroneopterin aldolase [Myxococcota bacterium]
MTPPDPKQPALPVARAVDGPADRVHGRGFSYDCRIGFHAYERHIRQRVSVDFEAETAWRESALRDRARDLVDYYEINKAIQELVDGREWRLIEALAEDIARLICGRFPVSRVRVRVDKLPFDMPNVGGVAVECWRTPADFEGIDEDALAAARGDR